MKKITTAAVISAAIITASSAYAAVDTARVDTSITASVENTMHVSGIPSTWALGAISPDDLKAAGGITQAANDVQIWTNATGATGVNVSVTSTKVAPAATDITELPEGQAVIAIDGPSADNPDAMVPVSMTCTPCNLDTNTAAAEPIQLSPAGNTATGSAPTNANEVVVSDTGGTRVVTINNVTGNTYTTQAACTTGTGVAATCTFQAGPTTTYEAEGGSYSGVLEQTYGDIEA